MRTFLAQRTRINIEGKQGRQPVHFSFNANHIIDPELQGSEKLGESQCEELFTILASMECSWAAPLSARIANHHVA